MRDATSDRPAAGRGGHADRGDIVIGWLTKMAVVTALVGLVGYDALSVGVAKVSVADDATTAVQAAAYNWQLSRHNIEVAYRAAQDALPDPVNEQVEVGDFAIDPDGTVHLTVHKRARTLLLYRVHSLAHYAEVSASAAGKSMGS